MILKYITLHKAAKIHKCTYVNLYQAVQRKALKAVKINGILNTTEEWLNTYLVNRNDREIVAHFNGKRTFNPANQEYSTKKAASILGISLPKFYKLVYSGQVKTYRKGAYHVVTQQAIENYLNKTETIEYEYVS